MKWARCLQYISVLVFFQMIGTFIAREEDTIKTKLAAFRSSSKPIMYKVFDHYRKNVFSAFFSKKKDKQELLVRFQDNFGYTMLSKWLASCSSERIQIYVDRRHVPKSKRKTAPPTPSAVSTAKRSRNTKSSASVQLKHAYTDKSVVIHDNNAVATQATQETFDAKVSISVNTKEHCYF